MDTKISGAEGGGDVVLGEETLGNGDGTLAPIPATYELTKVEEGDTSFFSPTALHDVTEAFNDMSIEAIDNRHRQGWDLWGGDGYSSNAEELAKNFFSTSPTMETKNSVFGNNSLDNDFGFLDSSGDGERSNSFATGEFNTSGSGVWDSPTRGGDMGEQQPFNPSSAVGRLSARECIQLIQALGNSLVEWEVDSPQSVQIINLMQAIQIQLMSEMQSPASSSHSPKTPRLSTCSSPDSPVDRAARFHREIAVSTDAAFTWSGQLPPRLHRNPTYSCKIFLGGVPFDITEYALINAFKAFGNVKIEWPGKETVPSQPKGYLYVIFEHEKQVKLLLQNCFLDYSKCATGDWYFKLTSKRFREKDVQVIPWALSDSNYVKCQSAKIDAKKTIFVGALHGMLNAEGLATIMNDLFGGVVYAGIDTDRHKYPIGSGRVTFNNMKSYMKAVSAAFVEIKTKFRKKVQVDPYLEDATCSVCHLQQGPYFCREWCCFHYFCRTCYQTKHTSEEFRKHRPLMRNANKPQGTAGAVTSVHLSRYNNRYNNNNNYHNNHRIVGTGGEYQGNSNNNAWGANYDNSRRRFGQDYGPRQDYGASRDFGAPRDFGASRDFSAPRQDYGASRYVLR